MVKIKDFWKCICEDFNYRLFSGVPCTGLSILYNTMSSKFMHYMPPTTDLVALNLINGARVAGTKGALLLDSQNFLNIYNSIRYLNIEYGIPLLILMYGTTPLDDIKCIKGNINKINNVINEVDKKGKIGIILISDGDLI